MQKAEHIGFGFKNVVVLEGVVTSIPHTTGITNRGNPGLYSRETLLSFNRKNVTFPKQGEHLAIET